MSGRLCGEDFLPDWIWLEGVFLWTQFYAPCDVEIVSEEHIFWSCDFSRSVLIFICSWWKIPTEQIPSFKRALNWVEDLSFKGVQVYLFQAVIYTYLWVIWNFRNAKCFKSSSVFSASRLSDQIQVSSFFWIKHRRKKTPKWCFVTCILFSFCFPSSILLEVSVNNNIFFAAKKT